MSEADNIKAYDETYSDALPRATDKPKKGDWLTGLTFFQCVICAVLLVLLLCMQKLAPASFDRLGEAYAKVMSVDLTASEVSDVMKRIRNFVVAPAVEGTTVFSEETGTTIAEDETTSDEDETTSDEDAATSAEDGTTREEKATGGEGGEDVGLYEALGTTSFAPYFLTDDICVPVHGRVSSGFGYRIHPVTESWSFHTGIDIAADEDTRIAAALDGVITEAGYNDERGYYIIMTHSDGLETAYYHCSELVAEQGARVLKGETVARVGSTGRSTGPHLHFEIRINNVRCNPAFAADYKAVDGESM